MSYNYNTARTSRPYTEQDEHAAVENTLNGGFENWSGFFIPDDWDYEELGDLATDETKTVRSTDSNTGTYACELETYHEAEVEAGDLFVSNVLMPDVTLAVDDTVRVRAYNKRVTGTAKLYVLYMYENSSDHEDYYFNFSGVDIGTWTVTDEGPTADMYEEMAIGDNTYAQRLSAEATLPSTNVSDARVFIFALSSTTGQKILLDDVEVLVNSTDTVTNGGFENWTAMAVTNGWDVTNTDSTIESSEDSHTGTYALKVTGSATNSTVPVISQGVENSNIYAEYDVSIWGKVDIHDPASNIRIWILDNTDLADTSQYWDGSDWQNMSTGGTLTEGEAITSITAQTYTEISGAVDNSDNGEICVYMTVNGAAAVAYIDDLSIETPSEFVATDFYDLVLKVAKDDLEDDSTLLRILDENDVELFNISGDAVINNGVLKEAVTEVQESPYNVTSTDSVLLVEYTSTGASSIVIPNDESNQGRILTIMDKSGNSNTNNITISTEGSGTINGSATLVISTDLDYVRIVCDDNDNWYIIG